jgi:anti-sigma B factor antagonist
MALNITTNNVDGVIVVYLSGAIFFGKESTSLRTLMKDLLNKSKHIVLDFGDVTYIDSGGLGTLVALYVSARKIGGDIRLARVSNHPKEALQITKIVTLFEVFEKTENAIASFKKAAAGAYPSQAIAPFTT